jgi:hypothetical protein
MSITLNLSIDQETFDSSGGYTPLPEDKYKVSIFEAEVKYIDNPSSAYNGKPRINFTFKVLPGEEYEGRRVFFGANAFPVTSSKDGKVHAPYDLISIGKAIGLSKEQIENIDLDEWLGGELELTLVHKPKMSKESGYKVAIPGEVREEAKSFRSLEAASTAASASKAPSKSKASKFSL